MVFVRHEIQFPGGVPAVNLGGSKMISSKRGGHKIVVSQIKACLVGGHQSDYQFQCQFILYRHQK